MARHYSRDADLTKKMGKVGEALELRQGKEAKKAPKVSNPGPNSVLPSKGDLSTEPDYLGKTES